MPTKPKKRSKKEWLSENKKWVIGIVIAIIAIVVPILIFLSTPHLPDFVISVTPLTGTVNPGGSIPFAINLECQNGYNKDVLLSYSGEPAGVIISFDQSKVNFEDTTTTVTVNVAANVSPNSYDITFLGRGSDGKERTSVYTLIVSSHSTSDFSISVDPTQGSALQGGSIQTVVTIASVNGYSKDASLSVSGQPSGAQVTFNPTSLRPSQTTSTMTITLSDNVQVGDYDLIIKAEGNDGKSNQVTYTLTISQTSHPVTTVDITTPVNGTTVSKNTTVQGTALRIPSGQVIWPIIYVHSVALYYPMASAVTVSQSGFWQTTITIGGPNDTGQPFDIIMITADQAGKDALVAYNQDVEKNHPGDYPGMPQLPAGLTEYDRVTVIRGPWT